MADIDGTIFIERPPSEVFDFVADERHEPIYNPQMVRVEKLTSGPVRVGRKYRAWMRSGRRTEEMLIETTRFDPPTILSSSTTLRNMTIHGTLEFSPEGEATRMSWSWQLEPRGLLRMLRPVVDLLGRRQEKRIWTGLKELLEGAKTERSKEAPHDIPDALDDRSDGAWRRRRGRGLPVHREHRLGARGVICLRNGGECSARF